MAFEGGEVGKIYFLRSVLGSGDLWKKAGFVSTKVGVFAL